MSSAEAQLYKCGRDPLPYEEAAAKTFLPARLASLRPHRPTTEPEFPRTDDAERRG